MCRCKCVYVLSEVVNRVWKWIIDISKDLVEINDKNEKMQTINNWEKIIKYDSKNVILLLLAASIHPSTFSFEQFLKNSRT